MLASLFAPPKTVDLGKYRRDADILVVATGKPKMITGDMIKPGATVIDVGINRMADGKPCGDVDFESVKNVADWLTPVPGGVGPMTITMLVTNTVKAAERFAESTQLSVSARLKHTTYNYHKPPEDVRKFICYIRTLYGTYVAR